LKKVLASRNKSAPPETPDEPDYDFGKNFVLWFAIVVFSTEQVKRKTGVKSGNVVIVNTSAEHRAGPGA
jgi:hypothetical protein